MDLSCLDDLVGIINDQDTRDADILYLNDLSTMSFTDNVFKIGNIIKGDVTLGSAIVTNLSMNTSNLTVGEAIKSKSFPFCTNIKTIDSATQVTMTQVANETCCESPFFIKSAGRKIIDDQIDFAKRVMISDILNYFQGCLRINQVVSNDIVGRYQDFDSNIIQAVGNQFRGLQVTIDKYPYLEFYLHKLRLFFDTAITDTIRVRDLIENRELTPINFTSIADQIVDIEVNRSFETKKQRLNLLFYYDAALTGYYESWISSQKSCGGCGGYSPNGYNYFNGFEVAKAGSLQDVTIDKTGESYGMSMTYSLNCTVAPFICSIRNLIQLPLMYKAASQIVNKAQHDTDKVNSWITLNRDNHKELADEYDNEYNMRMFGAFDDKGKKIKQGQLDRIILPKDICFGRKNKLRNITVIP